MANIYEQKYRDITGISTMKIVFEKKNFFVHSLHQLFLPATGLWGFCDCNLE